MKTELHKAHFIKMIVDILTDEKANATDELNLIELAKHYRELVELESYLLHDSKEFIKLDKKTQSEQLQDLTVAKNKAKAFLQKNIDNISDEKIKKEIELSLKVEPGKSKNIFLRLKVKTFRRTQIRELLKEIKNEDVNALLRAVIEFRAVTASNIFLKSGKLNLSGDKIAALLKQLNAAFAEAENKLKEKERTSPTEYFLLLDAINYAKESVELRLKHLQEKKEPGFEKAKIGALEETFEKKSEPQNASSPYGKYVSQDANLIVAPPSISANNSSEDQISANWEDFEFSAKPLGEGAFGALYKVKYTKYGTDKADKAIEALCDANGEIGFKRPHEGIPKEEVQDEVKNAEYLLNKHVENGGTAKNYSYNLARGVKIDGQLYIITKLEQGSLISFIESIRVKEAHGVLKAENKPMVLAQLIGGMGAAVDAVNKAGVIHKDIANRNFLVSPPVRAVLGDFGQSSIAGPAGFAAWDGRKTGPIKWMSNKAFAQAGHYPEQDIYALKVSIIDAIAAMNMPKQYDRKGNLIPYQEGDVIHFGFPCGSHELGTWKVENKISDAASLTQYVENLKKDYLGNNDQNIYLQCYKDYLTYSPELEYSSNSETCKKQIEEYSRINQALRLKANEKFVLAMVASTGKAPTPEMLDDTFVSKEFKQKLSDGLNIQEIQAWIQTENASIKNEINISILLGVRQQIIDALGGVYEYWVKNKDNVNIFGLGDAQAKYFNNIFNALKKTGENNKKLLDFVEKFPQLLLSIQNDEDWKLALGRMHQKRSAALNIFSQDKALKKTLPNPFNTDLKKHWQVYWKLYDEKLKLNGRSEGNSTDRAAAHNDVCRLLNLDNDLADLIKKTDVKVFQAPNYEALKEDYRLVYISSFNNTFSNDYLQLQKTKGMDTAKIELERKGNVGEFAQNFADDNFISIMTGLTESVQSEETKNDILLPQFLKYLIEFQTLAKKIMALQGSDPVEKAKQILSALNQTDCYAIFAQFFVIQDTVLKELLNHPALCAQTEVKLLKQGFLSQGQKLGAILISVNQWLTKWPSLLRECKETQLQADYDNFVTKVNSQKTKIENQKALFNLKGGKGKSSTISTDEINVALTKTTTLLETYVNNKVIDKTELIKKIDSLMSMMSLKITGKVGKGLSKTEITDLKTMFSNLSSLVYFAQQLSEATPYVSVSLLSLTSKLTALQSTVTDHPEFSTLSQTLKTNIEAMKKVYLEKMREIAPLNISTLDFSVTDEIKQKLIDRLNAQYPFPKYNAAGFFGINADSYDELTKAQIRAVNPTAMAPTQLSVADMALLYNPPETLTEATEDNWERISEKLHLTMSLGDFNAKYKDKNFPAEFKLQGDKLLYREENRIQFFINAINDYTKKEGADKNIGVLVDLVNRLDAIHQFLKKSLDMLEMGAIPNFLPAVEMAVVEIINKLRELRDPKLFNYINELQVQKNKVRQMADELEKASYIESNQINELEKKLSTEPVVTADIGSLDASLSQDLTAILSRARADLAPADKDGIRAIVIHKHDLSETEAATLPFGTNGEIEVRFFTNASYNLVKLQDVYDRINFLVDVVLEKYSVDKNNVEQIRAYYLDLAKNEFDFDRTALLTDPKYFKQKGVHARKMFEHCERALMEAVYGKEHCEKKKEYGKLLKTYQRHSEEYTAQKGRPNIVHVWEYQKGESLISAQFTKGDKTYPSQYRYSDQPGVNPNAVFEVTAFEDERGVTVNGGLNSRATSYSVIKLPRQAGESKKDYEARKAELNKANAQKDIEENIKRYFQAGALQQDASGQYVFTMHSMSLLTPNLPLTFDRLITGMIGQASETMQLLDHHKALAALNGKVISVKVDGQVISVKLAISHMNFSVKGAKGLRSHVNDNIQNMINGPGMDDYIKLQNESLKRQGIDIHDSTNKQATYFRDVVAQYKASKYVEATDAYFLVAQMVRSCELAGIAPFVNCKSTRDRTDWLEHHVAALKKYEKTHNDKPLLFSSSEKVDFLKANVEMIHEFSAGLEANGKATPGARGNRVENPHDDSTLKIDSLMSKWQKFKEGKLEKLKNKVKNIKKWFKHKKPDPKGVDVFLKLLDQYGKLEGAEKYFPLKAFANIENTYLRAAIVHHLKAKIDKEIIIKLPNNIHTIMGEINQLFSKAIVQPDAFGQQYIKFLDIVKNIIGLNDLKQPFITALIIDGTMPHITTDFDTQSVVSYEALSVLKIQLEDELKKANEYNHYLAQTIEFVADIDAQTAKRLGETKHKIDSAAKILDEKLNIIAKAMDALSSAVETKIASKKGKVQTSALSIENPKKSELGKLESVWEFTVNNEFERKAPDTVTLDEITNPVILEYENKLTYKPSHEKVNEGVELKVIYEMVDRAFVKFEPVYSVDNLKFAGSKEMVEIATDYAKDKIYKIALDLGKEVVKHLEEKGFLPKNILTQPEVNPIQAHADGIQVKH